MEVCCVLFVHQCFRLFVLPRFFSDLFQIFIFLAVTSCWRDKLFSAASLALCWTCLNIKKKITFIWTPHFVIYFKGVAVWRQPWVLWALRALCPKKVLRRSPWIPSGEGWMSCQGRLQDNNRFSETQHRFEVCGWSPSVTLGVPFWAGTWGPSQVREKYFSLFWDKNPR